MSTTSQDHPSHRRTGWRRRCGRGRRASSRRGGPTRRRRLRQHLQRARCSRWPAGATPGQVRQRWVAGVSAPRPDALTEAKGESRVNWDPWWSRCRYGVLSCPRGRHLSLTGPRWDAIGRTGRRDLWWPAMSWRRPTDPMVDLRRRAGGLLVFAVAAVVALIAAARPGLVAALLGLTIGWLLVVGVKWHALRKARNSQRASSRYRQPRPKEEPRGWGVGAADRRSAARVPSGWLKAAHCGAPWRSYRWFWLDDLANRWRRRQRHRQSWTTSSPDSETAPTHDPAIRNEKGSGPQGASGAHGSEGDIPMTRSSTAMIPPHPMRTLAATATVRRQPASSGRPPIRSRASGADGYTSQSSSQWRTGATSRVASPSNPMPDVVGSPLRVPERPTRGTALRRTAGRSYRRLRWRTATSHCKINERRPTESGSLSSWALAVVLAGLDWLINGRWATAVVVAVAIALGLGIRLARRRSQTDERSN